MATLEDMLRFVIFVFSIAFVAIVGVFFTYSRARKNGYQPPAASSFVPAGFGIGIAATIALNPADTDVPFGILECCSPSRRCCCLFSSSLIARRGDSERGTHGFLFAE